MKDLYSAGLRTALMGTVAVAAIMAAPAMAQEKAFNIPAQDAVSAVPSFVQQSDLQVLAAANELRGIRTNAVQGSMTADAALDALISGTGLTIKSRAGNSVVLARAARNAAKSSISLGLFGMPGGGGSQPPRRLIHCRSAQSRWQSVPWMEPNQAPRS